MEPRRGLDEVLEAEAQDVLGKIVQEFPDFPVPPQRRIHLLEEPRGIAPGPLGPELDDPERPIPNRMYPVHLASPWGTGLQEDKRERFGFFHRDKKVHGIRGFTLDLRNPRTREPKAPPRRTNMAMCEDFPACGHEQGCCPRFENGRQLDMVCTCGARLPVDNPVSLCNACLNGGESLQFVDDSDYTESDTNDYADDTPLYYDYYGGE